MTKRTFCLILLLLMSFSGILLAEEDQTTFAENPQALADMICWLYDHPDERKEKGRILYDFVSRKLTWAEVTREILTIIELDKGRSQFQRQE